LAGIESAHLNPAVKTIEKLAKGLEVSVSDLFSTNIEDE
jgi:DNA-binding XRE family transcriptional regulator